MFFGNRMKALRLERSLSLRSLAKKLDVSDSYLSMLETGKRECPDGKLLYLICKNLNCALTELTDDPDLVMIAQGMFGDPQADQPLSASPRDPQPPATTPCQNCKSKDAEIKFLRDALKSALDRIPKAQ